MLLKAPNATTFSALEESDEVEEEVEVEEEAVRVEEWEAEVEELAVPLRRSALRCRGCVSEFRNEYEYERVRG